MVTLLFLSPEEFVYIGHIKEKGKISNTEQIMIMTRFRNEECNIANYLESIKNQSTEQSVVEIIVVDNNSTDHTKKIAARYTDKDKFLEIDGFDENSSGHEDWDFDRS